MYLIRKGEKPRPVCAACHKAGDEGAIVPAGQVHICRKCFARLDRGEGLHVEPRPIPMQRAL